MLSLFGLCVCVRGRGLGARGPRLPGSILLVGFTGASLALYLRFRFRAVGGGGLWAVLRVRGLALAGALPCEVYPVGKLQGHFTCGFDFRHSLWLPFVAALAVLKGLRGHRKKKMAWDWFKKTYWKVKLGWLSYNLSYRCFSDRKTLLMIDCFHN